jgi:hypothetical protein
MCNWMILAGQYSLHYVTHIICSIVFSSIVELLHNSSSHCQRDQLIKLLTTIQLTRYPLPPPSLSGQKHSSQWFCNPSPLYSIFKNEYMWISLISIISLTSIKRKFLTSCFKKVQTFHVKQMTNSACCLLHLVSCLARTSTLTMVAIYSSETSVSLWATRC